MKYKEAEPKLSVHIIIKRKKGKKKIFCLSY